MNTYVRDTRWKKAYLAFVGDIALWLYCFLPRSEKMSLLFKEKKQSEVANGLLKLSSDTPSYDS